MPTPIFESSVERKHHPRVKTNIMVLKSKRTSQSRRKRAAKVPMSDAPSNRNNGGSDDTSSSSSDEKSFCGYVFPPERKPLTKHEKYLSDLNDRALKAFQNEDQELFVKIILETSSLYVRDSAVRLAAEMNWVKVVEQLLIRDTNDVYGDPEYPASLSAMIVELSKDCEAQRFEGRWLLKGAVISAVKKGRESVFNILVPIVGVDFRDLHSSDLFDIIISSQMDLDNKKKWLALIVKFVDEGAPRPLLENAIYHCADFCLVEHLHRLLRCLFSISREFSASVMGALVSAIGQHRQRVVHCIVDELKKASIPIDRLSMYAAEDAEDIKMVEYLCQNGCNSFSLQEYGKNCAGRLQRFLEESHREDLLPMIISG